MAMQSRDITSEIDESVTDEGNLGFDIGHDQDIDIGFAYEESKQGKEEEEKIPDISGV